MSEKSTHCVLPASVEFQFSQINEMLAKTGWQLDAVAEAKDILRLVLHPDMDAQLSGVTRSRAEILKEWRYLEYWYFDGAPLSVRAALYAGLKSGILEPAPEHRPKTEEFLRYFEESCAFKSALNDSEIVGGWLFPAEPEMLWDSVGLTRHLPGQLCEVGSWTGRSTILLASAGAHFCPEKHLHVVDDWRFGDQPGLYPYLTDGRNLRLEFENNLAQWLPRIRVHAGHIAVAHRELLMMCPNGLSLVFHDAGHTAKDFERDLALLAPLINRGGLLLIHDYVSKNFQEGGEAIDRWLGLVKEEFRLEKVVGSCAVIRKL